MKPEKLLRKMFDAAVEAAQPKHTIAAHLPKPPKGRTIVIGAGKGSAAMAAAFEKAWKGPLQGLVVTRYGYGMATKKIEVVEAAHPVPDAAGRDGAARMLAMVQGLTKDDLVVALVSGGASALLSLPAEGLTLEDKRAVNTALLKSGAPIAEMNIVRKHLSSIKGGRLAATAYPARVETLIISDVPGDDVSAVGSGPTAPDPSTFEQARAIIAKYGIEVPVSVARHLAEAKDETPKALPHARATLIASPQKSLLAAATIAREAGYKPLVLGDSIEGEARDVGFVHAGIALQARRFGQPVKPPCAIISGGETTVTVRGQGVGGRNVEFLLALALKLNGAEGIHALAADTDGVDGGAEVAGALISPSTLERARKLGIDPWTELSNNNGHGFFEKLGDQLISGPTLTNVNDLRIILID
ncbi:glycerate kinase type-2 family protein [Aestuariivirga litoralis]|uniref:glycerate kinase type-2 family protein n=1 Tax=Aestuariivirga litoralis TaxID=2650924 RepID=UPI0018C6E0DB|nr:glycerate kinase [Aestuariivirga litoralis]MBG1232200.1 glycerate kinase [Aestuariivirga litoralis]